MLVEQDSSIRTVYVRLLDEGTAVFRPAPAEPHGAETVRLLAPSDYDSEDESWEFEPGTIVRVERRTLEGQTVLVAVAQAM